jgi:peptidoglycan hydrolase CwlO-like protein
VGLGIADFIVIAFLVGAGCALSSVGLWVMLRQVLSGRQRELESRLDTFAGALKALEAKVAELSKVREKPAVVEPVAVVKAPATDAPPAVQKEDDEVTPETLVVIAAAVTAFLGKKVRIRSAKKLASPREAASQWSQYGRALVHGSHSPRARG